MDLKSKETQQELFEQFSDVPKKNDRFPGLSRTQKPVLLSTNTEQLLMGGILLILTLCGVFFLGVLRGKALSQDIPVSPPRTASPAPAAQSLRSSQVSRVPVAPPAVTSTETIAAKPYTIQLVTHRKKIFAEADMEAHRRAGSYSVIIPSGDYFQVCVGQYASKEDAKKDLARFSVKYKDCFLRRR